MTPKQIQRFRRKLLRWSSSRLRSFVWRDPKATPETILVSEMLLRKTRAEAVEPVVKELFSRFPKLEDLAGSDSEELSSLLRPIGLHRIRAEALKHGAEVIVKKHGGKVPQNYLDLISLPHLGRYGANAVLCFAYGKARGIIDNNIVRLFSRLFGFEKPREVHKANLLWDFADRLVSPKRPKEFNWALLDLAAAVCLPRKPLCVLCPLEQECRAHETGECGCVNQKA